MDSKRQLNQKFWRDDWKRIGKLKIPQGGHLPADTQRILKVKNEFFEAGATFRRKDGVWHCIHAAPVLTWMLKTPYDRVKTELLKRGCSWEWL